MVRSWMTGSGCALALTLSLLGGGAPERGARPLAPPQDVSALEPQYARELFFAVLEGLYEDGVSNAVVDRMLEVDSITKLPAWFVKGCPVCTPVLQALHVYRVRPTLYGVKVETDTFGLGLAEEVQVEILHRDRARASAAIQALLERWIERRVAARRLTEVERTAWRLALEDGRKRGMAILEGYRGLGGSYATMKTCPACEAGVGACAPR